jgi:hypothetical protein
VDVSPKPPVAPVYLGDAVYASFDGFHIWLHLNDHRSPPLVALEAGVYQQLKEYAAQVWGTR